MEFSKVSCVLGLLIGTLIWTTGSAAPTECHFNSRALCVHEGRNYSLGESWMEKGCVQCTCLHPIGVGCCGLVHQPVDFPPWCEVRVEQVTCKVSLVQSADPRLPCFPVENYNLDPSHGAHNLNPRHGAFGYQRRQQQHYLEG